MKRLFTISLVLALVLALSLPGIAFAKKGGVPANNKAKAATAVPAGESDDSAPAQGNRNGNGKDKPKDKAVGVEELEGEDLEGDEPEDGVTDPADGEGDEVGEAPAEKLTGIENALSRLQRNLERKQAQFQAGLRKGLPSGLQATIAKFMSWLGMDPEPAEEPEDGEESDEASETVEPEEPGDDVVDPELPDETGAPADTL